MKNIMWRRIILTGLAMEFIYGIYIALIRWYEPNLLANSCTLGGLMLIGGYWVGRKANTKHIIQGALVGLIGVLFYIIIVLIIQPDESQMPSDLHVFLENLAKILGGALGGYLGLIKSNLKMNHKKTAKSVNSQPD
jgi:putative membrane protein (TIGR04086 family)